MHMFTLWFPSSYYLLFFCMCPCNALECDIVWGCKQPNHLFISVTALRLSHQRLFTPVNVSSTSENMMSSYYHSCLYSLRWNLPTIFYQSHGAEPGYLQMSCECWLTLSFLSFAGLKSKNLPSEAAVKSEEAYMMPEDVTFTAESYGCQRTCFPMTGSKKKKKTSK